MRQVLLAVDQLANTLLGGWSDETLSARAWRRGKTSHRWNVLRMAIDLLLWFDPQHCFGAYLNEYNRNGLPREYRL